MQTLNASQQWLACVQKYIRYRARQPCCRKRRNLFLPGVLEHVLILKRTTFVSYPGAILPGHKLHMLFISALHAGGERILDAGRKHEAYPRTAEGAIPSWDDKGNGIFY